MNKKRAKSTKKQSAKARAAALEAAPSQRLLKVPREISGLRAAIDLLRDANRPVEARREALQALQAATFAALDFDQVRPDYVAALRQVAADQDLELRQRALGILARESDGFAQKALLDGLRNPKKALVPPDKALQLLSYDAHAGAYPVAREILQTSPDESVRREALRLLAGDPQSAPVIEGILANKSESLELRRMSATALHALNPEKLQSWASEAVLDKSEHKDMLATGLTALSQFGDAEALAEDKKLHKRVGELQTQAPAKVKQLAKQFVQKYGR
jgi:hypothetical protein